MSNETENVYKFVGYIIIFGSILFSIGIGYIFGTGWGWMCGAISSFILAGLACYGLSIRNGSSDEP